MENKIAELTEKILKEGVEKGEAQAAELVEQAKAQADNIVADAKKEAEKIVAAAQAQSEDLKRTVANEIKLSGQQALSGIKQQILDVIIAQAVDNGVSGALDDPSVVKELITAIAQSWKSVDGKPASLEVLLPESKRGQLENSLVTSVQNALKNGVSIKFSKALTGGFQIGQANAAYKISMSDENFKELFKEYLRPKAKAYLFGK